ncbi:MAG TPA: isoprenylcysteine carboxylmethyltransferase family protein [Streptosporangiaceae bacterium]|nr:isoprenylcysteine carboxylmethyltransferase family protein [Streptosporangiaceae bacterium]
MTASRGATASVSLVLRNLAFTIVVPGAGGAYVPWLILTRENGRLPAVAAWYAAPVIIAGVCLYTWCVAAFGHTGRGTPGLWDAPRQVVATGPYAYVRNPIYLAALLIVAGEAWLFLSPGVLLYAAGLVAAFQLLVVGYEEPRLRGRFGEPYVAYCHAVSRWLPRRSRPDAGSRPRYQRRRLRR